MRSDKHTKRRPSLPAALAILLAFAVFAAGGLWFFAEMGMRPVNAADSASVSVTIPQGASTRAIAELLEETGLIRNKTLFRIKSRIDGRDGNYKAGVYLLARDMSMRQIMEDLETSAKAETERFTVPEGLTVGQTAEALEKAGLVVAADFLAEIETGDFGGYRFLDGDAGGLEGYLYPETYEVYANATARDLIDRMLSHFDKLFTEECYSKAEAMGLSVREVVTIASLIERETRVPEERALVASVIKNRIDKGMPLQIDATIQYALGENKARLSYADLEIDSPYNTYKNAGLPPGPICSPRAECIEAALNPADTDYLYYVLRPELDGRHNFTKS
ncbi:MAG: endolytic transglycosylase MltG, partial [Clostridiales Family XIII bacterium]|nr:endolytic transglycosylase MltG [Clostridiales Family XIII bacterium]